MGFDRENITEKKTGFIAISFQFFHKFTKMMGTFWTERNFGIILMLVSGFGFAVCNLLYDIIEKSLNSLVVIFYTVCFGRIITSFCHDIIVGLYNYYRIQQSKNSNKSTSVSDCLIILTICNRDQIKGFTQLNNGITFLFLSVLSASFVYILCPASFIFVNDIGDSSAIYRSDTILASIISYSIKYTKQDWRQRYWLCILLVLIGVVLISSPSFDTNKFDTSQFIGYLLAFFAALSGALDSVFSTLFKKVQVEYISRDWHTNSKDNYKHNYNDNYNSIDDNEEEDLLWDRSRQLNNPPNNDDDEQDESTETQISIDDHGNYSNDDVDYDYKYNYNYNLIALNDNKISIVMLYGGGIVTGILCIIIFGIAYGLGFESEIDLFDFSDVTVEEIWYLVSLVMIDYIAAYLMNLGFLKVNNASLSSILAAVAVVFTYIFAYIFVQEIPTYLSIIGAILVSTGVAIAVSPIKCSITTNF